jgi:glutamate racemase
MAISPIGIFDSGIGGTSIWKEITKTLPMEDTIYLADSKNAPYGEKEKKEILKLSIKNTEFLLQRNCKLIVVACNTATTNTIGYLRSNYAVPFIGIEPAIKPAALNSKTKKVGVLATKGTLSSSLFQSTSQLHAAGIEIVEREGTGLVELLESGKLFSAEMEKLLRTYLEPMVEFGIDYLVLGCTHYPYLIPLLQKILPNHVIIIDSGLAVAKQTKSVLGNLGLLTSANNMPNYQFYTNTDVTVLSSFLNDVANNIKVEFLDF